MMWIRLGNVHHYSILTTPGWEVLGEALRSQKLWRWKYINSEKISLGHYLALVAPHSNSKKRVKILFLDLLIKEL